MIYQYIDFIALAKLVLKTYVAFSSLHLAVAVRAEMLFLAIDFPCVVIYLEESAANTTPTRLKKLYDEDYYDNSNDPFHL